MSCLGTRMPHLVVAVILPCLWNSHRQRKATGNTPPGASGKKEGFGATLGSGVGVGDWESPQLVRERSTTTYTPGKAGHNKAHHTHNTAMGNTHTHTHVQKHVQLNHH